MRKLILLSFQSPGDIVMLTAAVRDLHRAHPGQFQTDVRTSADALWENNPYITKLSEHEPGVEVLDMHYPLIHQSSQRPYHFIHGFVQYLEERLGVRIPVTEFKGDVHLSAAERAELPGVLEEAVGVPPSWRPWVHPSPGFAMRTAFPCIERCTHRAAILVRRTCCGCAKGNRRRRKSCGNSKRF